VTLFHCSNDVKRDIFSASLGIVNTTGGTVNTTGGTVNTTGGINGTKDFALK
jgi:hypothetical protein